jgi:hypothetical protein
LKTANNTNNNNNNNNNNNKRLLAYPAAVLLVAPLFSPYHRHCVVETAAVLCQALALSGLLVLFMGVGDQGKAFLKQSTIQDMGDLASSIGGGLGGAGGAVNGALSSGIATAVKAVKRKVAVDC